MVKDLQTEKIWSLLCENWLAVESEDGKVCRILPVANEEELTNFSQIFSARAVKGLADGHIWFSIVSRPPTSNFTRVQRLSCALCLLCCTNTIQYNTILFKHGKNLQFTNGKLNYILKKNENIYIYI